MDGRHGGGHDESSACRRGNLIVYTAIVFLPLLGSFIAGVFGRVLGARLSELVATVLLFVSAALSIYVFYDVAYLGHGGIVTLAEWIGSGRLPGELGSARRHAHRRDAGGGHGRLVARAPLLHRLHARGSAPSALLLVSVALHLRHADAGDGQQLPADVLRLGRRGPGLLSADRLLVSEGRRPMPPPSRPSSSTAWAISASRSASSPSSTFSARSISTPCSPPRPAKWARPSCSPATRSTC